MLLTFSDFYFDIDLFKWDEIVMLSKVTAFEELLKQALGFKNDKFNFIIELIKNEENFN